LSGQTKHTHKYFIFRVDNDQTTSLMIWIYFTYALQGLKESALTTL
jgi:hypothetical protein